MGIHGLFKNLGPPPRQSLAALSADHYTTNHRPFRLAIDISIWLFQIQSGKGGSNPALRTFYYRLLRLVTLNIHPLFVFDGPNKPLFKRNKKVGGPGVRVASVPEFLAKQLLKQFGLPWHVAPGEAEAECALLQKEGIVDAVLSEDVDTLMFGSRITIRNWAAEGGKSNKTPTHVDIYRADETEERSGIESAGMILVALMSGGDYLPEGIPGCGPKVACDAARAGFGKELCALGKKDTASLDAWKTKLEHEIKTNESKFFSRKNPAFNMPEDFPNVEVLGYYTHPCVSTLEKVARLRSSVKWDLEIDFDALRTFTGDAFDWRCLGGAKKFIRNLAPAMLVRELRIAGERDEPQTSQVTKQEKEEMMVGAIHGKRNHATTAGALEYRISFIPVNLVPIDLSIEDEDDDCVPVGGATEDSDAESELGVLPSSTVPDLLDTETPVPTSPTKRNRAVKSYDPSQPEKLWILQPFLQIGCPLLVELYEASFHDPKAFLKARRVARAAGKGNTNMHAAPKAKKGINKKLANRLETGLMTFAKITKTPSSLLSSVQNDCAKEALEKPVSKTVSGLPGEPDKVLSIDTGSDALHGMGVKVSNFKLPSRQISAELLQRYLPSNIQLEELDMCGPDDHTIPKAVHQTETRPLAAFARPRPNQSQRRDPHHEGTSDINRTPRAKKRQSPDLSSPILSQQTITSFYSPSTRKTPKGQSFEHEINEVIDLVSPLQAISRSLTPTPPDIRHNFVRSPPPGHEETRTDWFPENLPASVTKRRRKGAAGRQQPAPIPDREEQLLFVELPSIGRPRTRQANGERFLQESNTTDQALHIMISSPAPVNSADLDFASPSTFLDKTQRRDPLRMDLGINITRNPLSRITLPPSVPTAGDIDASMLPQTKASEPCHDLLEMAAATQLVRPMGLKSSRQHAPERIGTTSTKQVQDKKKRILLRDSLPGGWREIDAEEVDLTGDDGGIGKRLGLSGARKGWRTSAVGIVDLTDV